jgi:CBS domain-containing protein
MEHVELHDTLGLLLRDKGSEIWHVSSGAKVYDAIALMAEKKIGALLVMDEGKLVGILSERDYARKVTLRGKTTKETVVREIMSSPVIHASPKNTVGECMSVMTDHRIRHIPVVEEGTVVGVLSIGDIVKWIITAQQETITQLHGYITGRYPG